VLETRWVFLELIHKLKARIHELEFSLSTKRVIGLIGTEKSCPMVVEMNSNSIDGQTWPSGWGSCSHYRFSIKILFSMQLKIWITLLDYIFPLSICLCFSLSLNTQIATYFLFRAMLSTQHTHFMYVSAHVFIWILTCTVCMLRNDSSPRWVLGAA